MILSDRSIRQALDEGAVSIEPLGDGQIQPASVDLRLGSEVLVFEAHRDTTIDIRSTHAPDLMRRVKVLEEAPLVLHPREFTLGSTLEHVALGPTLVGRLEGKSSWGRLGLIVHSTAGFVDPGFRGSLTLELWNLAPLPIILYPGISVCQLSLMTLTTPVDRPYGSPGLGSHYQDQMGPAESRVWERD